MSFALSTYEKAKKFRKLLKELETTVSPQIIRTYILAQNSPQKEDVEYDFELDQETKEKIDELNALRKSGIKGEMVYAKAQAKLHGFKIPEDVSSGNSIVPGFSPKVLEKIPGLRVYELFILFTEKELDEYLSQANQDNIEEINNESDER